MALDCTGVALKLATPVDIPYVVDSQNDKVYYPV